VTEIAIRVENLSKQYRIGGPQAPYRTIRESLVEAVQAPFRRLSSVVRGRPSTVSNETIWALKDVSFEVKQGEVVGIIGRNGAGKTTLLRILSRITEPTEGCAEIHGRVGSLLEVGTGFHHELTGRENVYLNGAILGMKRTEIERKFDEIVAFAEIERFIDTPVKHYSSGMYVRLAFAVAAHLEPEILLVDEVLAVGDIQFQKKCLGKMKDTAVGGRTVLFVSHNMGAIRQLCPTCLWIDRGRLEKYGASAPVIDSYITTADASGATGEATFDEDLEKEFQLRSVRLLNEEGVLTQRFDCDKPVIIELTCQVHQRVPRLSGYLVISRDGTPIMVSESFDAGPRPLDGLPVGMYLVRITVPPRTLGPGGYDVYLNFASGLSLKGRNVDSPGVVGSFHLDDFTTHRGNKRLGHFSTILSWDVSHML